MGLRADGSLTIGLQLAMMHESNDAFVKVDGKLLYGPLRQRQDELYDLLVRVYARLRAEGDGTATLGSLKSAAASEASWAVPGGNPPSGKRPVSTHQLGHKTTTDADSGEAGAKGLPANIKLLARQAGLSEEGGFVVHASTQKLSVESFHRQSTIEKLEDLGLFDPSHLDFGSIFVLNEAQNVETSI